MNDQELATLEKYLGKDEGAPRSLTDSVSLPAAPAPRQFGAQEIRVITLAAGVPQTIGSGIITQYVDIVFELTDGYANVGSHVAQGAGVPVHFDSYGVKLGTQGLQQVSVVGTAGGRAYIVFNDCPVHIFGEG